MKKYGKSLIWIILLAVVALAVLTQTHTIVERSYSTVNRNAAIATVNGGEAEFINYQTTKSGGKAIDGIFYLAYLGVLIVSGTSIYKRFSSIRNQNGKEISS